MRARRSRRRSHHLALALALTSACVAAHEVPFEPAADEPPEREATPPEAPPSAGDVALAGGAAEATPHGRVRQLKPGARPAYDKDTVRRQARAHFNEVQGCFRQGQASYSDAARLNIRFVISRGGEVTSSEVASSAIADPRVEACLVALVRQWRFPETLTGEDFEVVYPFVYSSWSTQPEPRTPLPPPRRVGNARR